MINKTYRCAFTLIELIFVIVIIGVLASVAIPKFTGLSDNAKISAELSTAASVQVALDACHGEWIINEGDFTCGVDIDSSSELNSDGYPNTDTLGSSATTPLDRILKNAASTKWSKSGNRYFGPASDPVKGAKNRSGKPGIGDYWTYNPTEGTFTLVEN